jgi:hypothetical protein
VRFPRRARIVLTCALPEARTMTSFASTDSTYELTRGDTADSRAHHSPHDFRPSGERCEVRRGP